MGYSVVFEYHLNDKYDSSIMVSASCDDVENYASNLKINYSGNFKPDFETVEHIEAIVISKLLDEKIRVLEK